MNNNFNLNRFVRLLKNDLMLNHKFYLLVLAGAVIILYVYLLNGMTESFYSPYDSQSYNQVFVLSLFALGAFVGTAFPAMSDSRSASTYLLVPASTFEKFLSQFLIRAVFGFVFLLFSFWFCALLARWTALRMDVVIEKGIIIKSLKFNELFGDAKDLIEKIVISLTVLSIGMFLFAGRLFFKRWALGKTIVSGAVILYLIFCFMVVLSHIFYPETQGFNVNIPDYEIIPEYTISKICFFCFFSFSWVFFILLAYYKLKEKQL